MTSLLDRSEEAIVAELLLNMMEEGGFTPEEFIPGMMLAARLLASRSNDGGQVLNEVAALLDPDEDDPDNFD